MGRVYLFIPFIYPLCRGLARSLTKSTITFLLVNMVDHIQGSAGHLSEIIRAFIHGQDLFVLQIVRFHQLPSRLKCFIDLMALMVFVLTIFFENIPFHCGLCSSFNKPHLSAIHNPRYPRIVLPRALESRLQAPIN